MNISKIYSLLGYLVIIAILLAGTNNLLAQDKKAKAKPRLRMNYYKYMDGKIELRTDAYYKKENKRINCTDAVIEVFTDESYKDKHSEVVVDQDGCALLELTMETLQDFIDSTGKYNFYVRLKESELFREREADISIQDASIEMEFLTEDSVKYVNATLTGYNVDSSRILPLERFALKSFIQRSLSLYPIGGDLNYTDKNGEIKIVFPEELLGDEEGNLTVIVKLDEDDDFGTVEAKSVIDWGIPYTDKVHHTKGLLIGDSEHAPMIMLIGINGILILIWGFLMYILYNIVKIKKLGKKHPLTSTLD